MIPPSAPPASASKPMSPPSPSSSPGGGGGDSASRAADAMVGAQEQEVSAIASLNPEFDPGSGGFSVAKIKHITELVNDVIEKYAPQAKGRLTWEAPKKGGKFFMAQFPARVFVPTMQLLLMVAKALPPELAAKVSIDPSAFGSDEGLDAVVARLATLLKNKDIYAALSSGSGPGKKSAPPPPAAKKEEPPPAAPPHAEPDGDEDMSLAAAGPMM